MPRAFTREDVYNETEAHTPVFPAGGPMQLKTSDILWIRNLVSRARGIPIRRSEGQIIEAQAVFLQELCDILQQYASHFNSAIEAERPDAVVRVFRFGNPRPGLMVLRGRDKLILSAEGDRIRARIVQVHAYNEQSLEIFQFRVEYNGDGDVVCRGVEENQLVTPELVVRHSLGHFLAEGCSAFAAARPWYQQTMAVQVDS